MVDFRSRIERDNEERAAASQDADYKRMYQEVLAKNEAFRAKLDEITASHGELQGQFADLLSQFEALKASTNERADDLLKISRNTESMVAEAYQKQGDLMDRFRADLSQRLGAAKATVDGLDEPS